MNLCINNHDKTITGVTVLGACRECRKRVYKKARLKRLQKDPDFDKKQYQKNKAKRQEQGRKYYHLHKEICKQRHQNWMLLTRYGLSAKDYQMLLIKQRYCCKICGIRQNKLKRDLDVDHCHKTNRVRGLLCNLCNSGLGSFKDNSELLKKAITYLCQTQ